MENPSAVALPTGAPNQRLALIIGATVTVVVLALLAGVVWLSQRAGGDEAPPALPPFQPPAIAAVPAFEVRSVTGGSALIVADPESGQSTDITRTIDLASGIGIEQLAPMLPAEIAVGEIVTAIGVYNEVRNFTVHYIVVQPGGTALDGDGTARSALGFAGHEAMKGDDRPILSGEVVEVTGGRLQLRVGDETVWLDLLDVARVYALEPGNAASVVAGGRLALIEGNGPIALLASPAGFGN